MKTSKLTLRSRAKSKISFLMFYTAILGSLGSCADSSDSAPVLAAAKSRSTEISSRTTQSANLYSDVSDAGAATDGFVGELIDDSIRISWKKDTNATGYNVYRQGEYYTTVFSNTFVDRDIHAADYSYRIIAFEKNDEETRYYTIAKGLIVSLASIAPNLPYFKSSTTPGFSGEVQSDGILIRWEEDKNASGYNIYRQGEYLTTVFSSEFLDTNVNAQDYSYSITAFDNSGANTRFYSIAEDLMVSASAPSVAKKSSGSIATQVDSSEEGRDGVITISWDSDPNAEGYNVYREGKYFTTVMDTEFHDKDVNARDYTYEIIAFEKSGGDARFYSVASDKTVRGSADTKSVVAQENIAQESVAQESVAQENDKASSDSNERLSSASDVPVTGASNAGSKYFKSQTTEGFVGEVLEDSIRISWNEDLEATGYNVYRQAEYYTTVFETEFNDTDVYDQDYYYEIQAFDHGSKEADARYYYIATGLTVSARTLGKTDPDAPKPNEELLKEYELVFADEFNGSSLDTSKWNTSFLWGTDLIINGEEQYYVDIANDPGFGFNPFTFDGNNMTINSIKTPPKLASKSNGQPYLSGIITSYDAFKFTYGYAEIRAKMTYGRGYWPAFWLLNAYYGGDDPEIDIMEFIGDNQDVVYHTFHYYDENGKLRSSKSKPTTGIDFTADFHTFAVEWAPGSIVYFVDGIEVHRITNPKVPMEQMYLLANTAVGGWWPGAPDETTPFPGKYTIDYIRVYQKAALHSDAMLNDGVTNGESERVTSVLHVDDLSGRASPPHRPTREQWPDGYPYD